MHIFDKFFGSNNSSEGPDLADKIAANYVKVFNDRNNWNLESFNKMSETLVTQAHMYWNKGDFESYNKLLSVAEETSFLYQGNKYPHDLVEDLIRNIH